MIKLSRYLKPFLPAITVVVVLLFAQTISELYLPNLMGNIVNVGIQQGGIEEGSPKVLSQDAMRLLNVVMDSDGRALLEQCYSLVDGDSTDSRGRSYAETWPDAAGTQIYALNIVSKETLAELDEAFGIATWTVLNLVHPSQGGAGGAGGAGGNTGSGSKAATDSFDMKAIYQMLPELESLPAATIEQARAAALMNSEQVRSQSATIFTSALYSDLGADMTKMEMSYIARIGFIMIAVAIVTGLATVLINLLTTRIGTGVARTLRTVVFSKVASFSHTEFDRFSTASLITRSTNDVMMMQRFVGMGLRMVAHAPILGIGAAIMAVRKSPSMSWVIAVAVVLVMGIAAIQIVILMPKFRLIQEFTDKLNLVAREKLTGLMVIRAFNRDDVEMQRFDRANTDVTDIHIFTGRVMASINPLMTIVMNGVQILIIWVGGHQIAQANMQVGDMMAYMQYIMQVMMSFMQMSMMFNMIPRAQVSAGRITEVLDTIPAIHDPEKPLSIEPNKRGMIEFKDVSFRYENAEEDALQHISFKAEPGQTIAFIGPTGSGKTTIMNLVPRLYEASQGSVLVGDVDVRDLTQTELRSHIGYVPQRSILMGGTIASNIAYGVHDDELAYDDYLEIAAVAQAIDFIGEKDTGFYTPIAQGGSNVSGGQRQRLAIARALAVRPDVFIFDDSFSALDFATDAALRKALKEHTSSATLLIVSQRIGTIMDADMIHVIDEGRIIGSGTHDELLQTCETYFEIASTQLAEVAQAASRFSLTEGGDQ
ncbi:MAG: ABC transporter ATP-binding protein/permease [Coriobacteriia bacterium]|nr:ABC transporter ATP-binding protein/permease [Coriobacteriia bacterium]